MAVAARKQTDGSAQFAPSAQKSANGTVDACGPKSPDSHRVVWGLTTRPPVSPGGLSSGFPFAHRVPPLRPPSPGFPSSGVLRFAPFGHHCPVPVPLRFPAGCPSPLSNLHVSAAARPLCRRWSQAARTKVTSSAPTPRLDRTICPRYRWAAGRARGNASQVRPISAAVHGRGALVGGHTERDCALSARSASITSCEHHLAIRECRSPNICLSLEREQQVSARADCPVRCGTGNELQPDYPGIRVRPWAGPVCRCQML
jgi:hypothetical protein